MCIHNLSCHAFTHRADQASRTCNNNTTGYRRVPNFPPSESLPSTVMHPFPKSPPQNQPRLAPAGRPGGLADRPGVKTAHRCVACHQVYLPDFERKARVGVRAQPARNHWKKRQRHIKSSSYTLPTGAVLLLLQSCLPWPTPPPPSDWAGLLPCLIKGVVITSDHRLPRSILRAHAHTVANWGTTWASPAPLTLSNPSLARQGSKRTGTARGNPPTGTQPNNASIQHVSGFAVQPVHNEGFGKLVTSRFGYTREFKHNHLYS